MGRLRKALERLPCRHLLIVLDCCFAGSFRWAPSRGLVPLGRPLYDSQYARFLTGTAWQVLTSASHQESALDVAPGTRHRAGTGRRAEAIRLLRGAAPGARRRGGFDPGGATTRTA